MRKKWVHETVWFDGREYKRPVGKRRGKPFRYFWAKWRDRKTGRMRCESLHRAVWSYYNGRIPRGRHIHHKDEDYDNNDVDNLECLTRSEHMLKHRDKFTTKEHLAILERIRKDPVAQAKSEKWRRSKEGKSHYRKIGAITQSTRKLKAFVCGQCGAPFERRTHRKVVRFCGPKCRDRVALERRLRNKKVKRCLWCRKRFKTAWGATYCGNTCAANHRWSRARVRPRR